MYYANTKQQAAHIGFNDEFIYQELAILLTQRTIPFIHLPDDIAKWVFEQWIAKSDKIFY